MDETINENSISAILNLDPSLGINIFQFIINQLVALVLANILFRIYSKYGRSLSNRSSFGSNFSLLSMTTMLIITIVKSSLALSLGLVGALSIVRFRTAIKEPEELVYVFICIAIGLGLGANQTLITIIGFSIISLYIVFNRRRKIHQSSQEYMNLILTCSDMYNEKLEEIIKIISKYSNEIKLNRYSEKTNLSESSLTVMIKDFNSLISIRSDLIKMYPNITIDFLDNNGILANY